MTITLLPLLLLFITSTSTTASTIRGSVPDTTCAELKSSNECHTLTGCSWCECAAVPSMCVSTDSAAQLPDGIWQCSGVEVVAEEEVVAEDEEEEEEEQRMFTYVYPHLENVSHSLRSASVDANFCDPESPRSLSGYMDISGSQYDKNRDKHYFYWFFEKRQEVGEEVKEKSDVPLIVWLTGGPGCSSTLALLTENGPCRVNADGTGTIMNPNSWINVAHMLWLDQPAGVGFSYGDTNDKNEEMVAEDAYYFLQAFFKSHPEYQDCELFIVGESYGGHYAPAIANRVMLGNEASLPDTLPLKLTGVGVGNGLTDPAIQYQYYAEMAYHNSHGIQAVDEKTYQSMKDAEPTCVSMIDSCNKGGFGQDFRCQVADTYCNTKITGLYYQTGLNPYDIRKECGDQPLCYDFSNVSKFMNLDSTKQALHVDTNKSHAWETCNNSVNYKFRGDFVRDYASDVTALLDKGDVRVMIYAGDVDFICNYLGNQAWTLALKWGHTSEFNDAEELPWNHDSGLIRSSHNLSFVQVFDAGHMVPTDQPEVALDLITQFIKNEFIFTTNMFLRFWLGMKRKITLLLQS